MSTHVVEVGPNNIRQLCCGAGPGVGDEMVRAAFDGIDDPVTLVDLRPVGVGSLWRTVLESVDCGRPERAIVVYPSWWAPTRIDVLSAAAQVLADKVVLQPRSWLLTHDSQDVTVVVEIADCFVVITGATVVAETRCGEPMWVAEAVVGSILDMASGVAAVVVMIDAPSTVSGARGLATMIAEGLRVCDAISTLQVDDVRFKGVAAELFRREASACESHCTEASRRDYRRHRAPVLLAVLLLVLGVLGVVTLGRRPAPVADGLPTTFLVEGRVALEIPAQWSIQRVIAGPGSARVQVTSPADPEVALHVTQSRVAVATLSATAESLKNAIDAEPAGVFVDFNPVGSSAGRPAVTYREVRGGHDIRWIVLVDKAVRISIGCQSRHGHDDAVRQVCELAVRSARALS